MKTAQLLSLPEMESTSHDLIYEWLSKLPDRPIDQPTKLPARGNSTAAHLDKGREHGYERRSRRKTRQDHYEYKASNSAKGSKSRGKKTARPQRGRKHTMNDSFHAPNVPADRLTLHQTATSGIFSKGKTSSPIKLREVPDLAFSELNFLARRAKQKAMNNVGGSPAKKQDGKQNHKGQRLFEYKLNDFSTPRGIKRKSTQQENDDSPMLSGSKRRKELSGSVHEFEVLLDTIRSEMCDSPHASQPASQKKTEGDIEGRLSATPYTWFASELDVTEKDCAVESYLLNLLHVGLHMEQMCDSSNDFNSNKTYWSLNGLKKLLEERKQCWESVTSKQDQNPADIQISPLKRKSSPGDLTKSAFGRVFQREPIGARNEIPRDTMGVSRTKPMDNGNQPGRREEPMPSSPAFHSDACAHRPPTPLPKVTVDSRNHQSRGIQKVPTTPVCLDHLQESMNGPKHQLQDDLCPSCVEVEEPGQDFQSQLGTQSAQPLATSDLANIALCGDDELFYRTMDAAYAAIVNRHCAEQAFLQDDCEPNRDILPSPFQDADQLASAEASLDEFEEALLNEQVACTRSSYPALGTSHFPQNGLKTGQNDLPHDDELLLNEALPEETQHLSWLAGPNGENFLTTTALGSISDPIPEFSGFWRQNKLY